MPKDYTVICKIICDDGRVEDNGKQILLGVYNNTMLVTAVPQLLPTFCVWVQISIRKTVFDKVVCSIRDDENNVIGTVSTSLSFKYTEFNTSSIFKMFNMSLPKTGKYKIFLGMDQEEEEIGEFLLITREQLPRQDADKA